MQAACPAFDGFAVALPERRAAGTTRADQDARRMLDIALSVLALIVLSPILALATLAIALDSPGPILFCQRRTGLNGKPFGIFKFRTMTVLEDGDVVIQATAGDARITRVGRFLRTASIDELPQLFNVLAGDMSLVGPRPHAIAHDEYYGARIPGYDRRFAVKPGITGWAQVQGARGATPTLEHMRRASNWTPGMWTMPTWPGPANSRPHAAGSAAPQERGLMGAAVPCPAPMKRLRIAVHPGQ